MILLNEISKMQGDNKNKLYMSKLIKIVVDQNHHNIDQQVNAIMSSSEETIC